MSKLISSENVPRGMEIELGWDYGKEVGPDLGAYLPRDGCQEEGNIPEDALSIIHPGMVWGHVCVQEREAKSR